MNIILYFPQTKAGQEELAKRVATVHAQAVLDKVKSLNCPTQQKNKLIDAVLEKIREDMAKEARE